jgi:hypothetical protein
MTLIFYATGETVDLVPGRLPAWQPAVIEGTESLAEDQRFCTVGGITQVDKPKGNYLEMCADGKHVEMGPLENGNFAMGPNGEFFVYCGNSGPCYAAKFGADRLTGLGTVKEFAVIKRGETPKYAFTFDGDGPYTVIVRETIGQEYMSFAIPSGISKP